ncbi:MAG: PDZ domain-containing protein, partial [Sandaracinobacter sp.]
VLGVVVAQVSPSSDAAEQGIQRGDIIGSVNQQPVRTPQEAATAVAAARKAGRDTVLLFVQRGNTPGRFVGVKIQ